MNPKQAKLLQDTANELIRCKFDCRYFIEKYCKLKDQKLQKPIPFKLWSCQVFQLGLWLNNRFNVTLKRRQIGISWLSAAYALWKLLFNTYFEAMVVSRKESDAIKYLNKAKFMYEHLPEPFKIFAPLKRQTNLSMEWDNESSFMAESSNPHAGRSETLNLFIPDEAAFIPDGASIYFQAAEPALERTDGQAIVISTGNGYDKFFQPIYKKAKDQLNQFTANFIPWDADPEMTDEKYERMKRYAIEHNRLREFQAEYPKNDVEAFIVSGYTFYDPQIIQDLLNKKMPPYEVGNIKNPVGQINFLEKASFITHDLGPLKVWEKPQFNESYCVGVDVAEGVKDGDFSVAAVYNRVTKKQAAEYAYRTSTENFGKVLLLLGYWYNTAIINIEMNSVGESVLNTLVKKNHYPDIYHQIRYDERSNKRIKKLGWRTTASSKRVLLDSLEVFLREKKIHPYSTDFIEELSTFVAEETEHGNWKYHASGNNKDDRVIAHALCAIIFQFAPLPPAVKRRVAYSGKDRLSRPKKRFQYNLGELYG